MLLLFAIYGVKNGECQMAEKIICASCGAEIEEDLPRCPYCDTLLIEGAQREYREKLEKVREDMAGLEQLPRQAVKQEIRKQGRKIRSILLIAGGVALVLAVLFWMADRRYERDNKKDYIWGQQHFPAMSELYENGKFEELEKRYLEALFDDKPVWNWEYYEEFSDWLEEQE